MAMGRASLTRNACVTPGRLSAPRLRDRQQSAATLPPRTSAPQKTRQSQVWSLSREEQFNWAHGNISLCTRVRPGDGEHVCLEIKDTGTVSMSQHSPEPSAVLYSCDHTFGPEATQEQVYQQAVSPICESVLHGYNGAVIAYGQTGSGKTHTMIGSTGNNGVAPQAVFDIFRELSKRQKWAVEVSVLEIYNEKVRDLLAPSVTVVEIHEVFDKDVNQTSFHCPDATRRKVVAPEEALMALSDGMRRRETARTDMNHHSSRSHLIFTLTVVQGDPEVGATLNGRLHIVDLAGSERLKRSMASEYDGTSTPLHPMNSRSPRDSPTRITSRLPKDSPKSSPKSSPNPSPRDSPVRDQRREAGDINKSLSQLALVIQRLTAAKSGSLHQVPYRDSVLTRLLAESFGGSSKTCLIITCSPSTKDREETRCSLEFGKRAKLVENKAEINVGMKDDAAPVMEALMQKEFAGLHSQKEELKRERDNILKEREDLRSQLAEALKDREHFVTEVVRDRENSVKELDDLRVQLAEAQENFGKEREDLRSQLAEAQENFAKERTDLRSHLAAARETFVKEREDLRSQLAEAHENFAKESEDLRSQLAEVKCQKEEKSRERGIFAEACECLQSQLAEAQHRLVEAASEAAKRHEIHSNDFKRVAEENVAMRSRLEQTLATLISESRQLEDARRERAAVLKAEKTLLAEEWQAQLKRSSIATDNSHPPGSNSISCNVDSIDASTADGSMADSSDVELLDFTS